MNPNLRAGIAIAIFFLSCVKMKNQMQVYCTSFGETQIVTLDDSTTVIMNAESTVSYRKQFDREVWVDGEVYFKVSPGSKPLVIRHDRLMFKCNNGSFNFNSYDTKGPHYYQNTDTGPLECRLAVYEGEVNVYTSTGAYHLRKEEFALVKPDYVKQDYWDFGKWDNMWLFGYYLFDIMRMDEFGHMVSRAFAVKVLNNVNGSASIEHVCLETIKPLKDQLSKLEATTRFKFTFPNDSTVQIDYCL